jgi:pyrimidine-nucleoside phosphorylase
MLKIAISDGSALKKFKEMVEAHGGSTASLDDPNTHTPKYSEKVYAERDGYIISMNTLSIGMAIKHLGGGRTSKIHGLDPTVGIIFHKKVGNKVNNGDVLLEYFCSQKDKFILAKKILQDVYDFDSKIVDPISLVY